MQACVAAIRSALVGAGADKGGAKRAARLVVAGLMVLAAACGGWSGPSLRPAGAGSPNISMVGIPKVSPAHHALQGEMIFCLTGPGRAVITAVGPFARWAPSTLSVMRCGPTPR